MPTIVRIKKLLLPPAGPLLLAILGCLALPWFEGGLRDAAFGAVVLGLGLLYLLSLPRVGFRLLRTLEEHVSLDPATLGAPKTDRPENPEGPGAIVVLDAGRYARTGAESGGEAADAVKPQTLERLRHGARLARRSGLPVLVSGNGAGSLMADVLADDFGVDCRWVEPESRNTQENAERSAAILRAEGIDHAVLVTHAWHLPRAVRAFERAGLRVVPAPMGFAGPDRWELRLLSFVPSIAALEASHLACHEWVGRAWYALRYGNPKR